jgi:hypothetical protein
MAKFESHYVHHKDTAPKIHFRGSHLYIWLYGLDSHKAFLERVVKMCGHLLRSASLVSTIGFLSVHGGLGPDIIWMPFFFEGGGVTTLSGLKRVLLETCLQDSWLLFVYCTSGYVQLHESIFLSVTGNSSPSAIQKLSILLVWKTLVTNLIPVLWIGLIIGKACFEGKA